MARCRLDRWRGAGWNGGWGYRNDWRYRSWNPWGAAAAGFALGAVTAPAWGSSWGYDNPYYYNAYYNEPSMPTYNIGGRRCWCSW